MYIALSQQQCIITYILYINMYFISMLVTSGSNASNWFSMHSNFFHTVETFHRTAIGICNAVINYVCYQYISKKWNEIKGRIGQLWRCLLSGISSFFLKIKHQNLHVKLAVLVRLCDRHCGKKYKRSEKSLTRNSAVHLLFSVSQQGQVQSKLTVTCFQQQCYCGITGRKSQCLRWTFCSVHTSKYQFSKTLYDKKYRWFYSNLWVKHGTVFAFAWLVMVTTLTGFWRDFLICCFFVNWTARHWSNDHPTHLSRVYFFAFPWAATAAMAFCTVSSSPRNCMGPMGFRFLSNSYTTGIPVGRFSSMMASSDIPAIR